MYRVEMRHFGWFIILCAFVGLAQPFGAAKSAYTTLSPTTSGPPSTPGPPSPLGPSNAEEIWKCFPRHFIISIKKNARQSLESWIDGLPKEFKAQITHTYEKIFKGVAVKVADGAEFKKKIAQNKDIEMWAQNCEASLFEETPWGLDRIDQRALPLDNSFLPLGTGRGVNIYVVDSGIHSNHKEFGGRAQFFSTFDGVTEACDGHGTFVAGIAAGAKYGVAKEANVFNVRVLGCGRGSYATILHGLDLIMQRGKKPAVINMSLGGPVSSLVDLSVRTLTEAGFVVIAAAGNRRRNACTVSPAREPLVITVGSSTINDGVASDSNFGECLDLFAPGEEVRSAFFLSDTGSEIASGTSFAAPYVTGVAALLLEKNPEMTPAEVAYYIVNQATSGILSGLDSLPDTPNLLLFTRPRCSKNYYQKLLQDECVSDCELCRDDCSSFSYNGFCDDSGPNSWTSHCQLGQDCYDCGVRDASICDNYCSGAHNGICEDERGYHDCPFGSDCDDCGIRCYNEKPHHIWWPWK